MLRFLSLQRLNLHTNAITNASFALAPGNLIVDATVQIGNDIGVLILLLIIVNTAIGFGGYRIYQRTNSPVPFGASVTNQFHFQVNGEDVSFTLSESKDEIPHTITQAEKMQLLKYEEEKRKSTWASKPKIPKYDHPWSGRLTITIIGKYKFSDCKSYSLEERIGEMMIAFYEASYAERLKRLEAEEKRRKEEEERRRAEEIRARRNKEIDYTEGLINAAEDYDSACKLRAYIAAMKAAGKASEEWIEWATAKANWLDPTIRAEDPYFGVREHEQSEEYKKLKKKGYWY